jgi:preprotein translocase subunit SecG
VKVFGIVALVVVLLFVVLLLTRGHHGPGRHMSGGRNGVPSPPAGVPDYGEKQQ